MGNALELDVGSSGCEGTSSHNTFSFGRFASFSGTGGGPVVVGERGLLMDASAEELKTGTSGRRRAYSADSTHSHQSGVSDPWGWFEDTDPAIMHVLDRERDHAAGGGGGDFSSRELTRALSLPPPATEPPSYVLEASLATQHLWYSTAGQRPKQPAHEREYFERLWIKNFELSRVEYKENAPPTQTTSSTAISSATGGSGGGGGIGLSTNDEPPLEKDFLGEILFRGKGPFSNSVTKSFVDDRVASLTLQLPRFRIIRTESGEVHAEFLCVVAMRGLQSVMTFGIWKRHSDFARLAKLVQAIDLRSESRVYKNALLSWQCLLHRKRWFRCLDKDYLALKCFLLERFLHDVLFESQTSEMISAFLELDTK